MMADWQMVGVDLQNALKEFSVTHHLDNIDG